MVFVRDVDSVDLHDAISELQSSSLCRRPAFNVLYVVATSTLDSEQVEPVALKVSPGMKVTQSHHRSLTISVVVSRISRSRHRQCPDELSTAVHTTRFAMFYSVDIKPTTAQEAIKTKILTIASPE